MKAKKIAAFILSALMLTGALSACGDKNSASDASGSKADNISSADSAISSAASVSNATTDGEKIKITVTRWGETEEKDAENEMVKKFNAENDKNIEIVYDVIPGDGYGDRLTTSFASGEGYDVFASGEGDFYKWVDKSLAAPLDDYIAKDTSFVNEMDESIYRMGNINDKQYYFVRDYNPIALFYNKDVFDKHKVAYPTDTWTWDDLEAAAKKLTVKEDGNNYESFGFNAMSWEYIALTYLQSQKLNVVKEDGSTVEGYLNHPDVVKAMEKYVGWSTSEDRISPSASDLDTFGDATGMFNEGKLAMSLDGGWVVSNLDKAGINYGTALVPGTHESYLCASAYAMSSRCKNPEAAWEVIKALTGKECSELRVENNASSFPTMATLLEEVKTSAPDKLKGILNQIELSVQPISCRFAIGSPTTVAFKTAIERMVYKDGEPQTIFDDAVAEVKEATAN